MKLQTRQLFLAAAIAASFAAAFASTAANAQIVSDQYGDRVTTLSDNHIAEDETVHGKAVAVCGDLTIDGRVTGDAVALCGDLTINGVVDGKAVAVMGDLVLGPNARVRGEVVCTGGTLKRDPHAVIGGRVRTFRHSIWNPFAFHSPWAWIFALLVFGFYALVALLFPGAVRSVGDKLVEQPGMSLLAAFLTVLALPVVFFILCVTVVGIPLAILLVPTFIALAMFGKASFYALIGRKITQDRLHISAAVLVGGLICLVFFIIPWIGIMINLLISLLMVGCCVTALFGAGRKGAVPPSPAAPAAATASVVGVPAPTAAIPLTPPAESRMAQPLQAEPPPMALPPPAAPAAAILLPPANASMPRAGFWIRTAALLIDLILIGAVFCRFLPLEIPLVLAVYGACLWKYRGSTVGGIIFGLRVVRMDDRPIDWTTAIVRALGCYLSLIAVGLGFIWVAFDPERQSWHDKIAGTTVVRPPEGVSLV
jgi:uncharacterized RDD family membrane protein YckC